MKEKYYLRIQQDKSYACRGNIIHIQLHDLYDSKVLEFFSIRFFLFGRLFAEISLDSFRNMRSPVSAVH